MGQEFTIKSEAIESKINQLLPSQGGYQPGVDFSASTMVIPIVDLTETAEGSALRQDLQSALSFDQQTRFSVNNTTTTIVNTTGFYRVFGAVNVKTRAAASESALFILSDGFSNKTINEFFYASGADNQYLVNTFDFIIKLTAGDSFIITASLNAGVNGSTRQIADINGNLT